ncbi:hypothetical protein TRAPUB_12249 [Trametes pubescens]|uniref:F-box domain-containing protein n=1 Tax=Trametes pubescens TaxID=154538 RepID=A0A1M2VUD3_TRAPU|nr:hypothetical protein TRAPUB_12249 [Trametes pubescens]
METATYPPGIHALLSAPDEIILEIIYYLSLQEVTALRKTCRRLRDTTQDHSVWLHILRREGEHLPLPRHIADLSSLVQLSSAQLEAVVRRLCTVNRTWLLSRTHYFSPGHRQSCALDPIFDNDDGARSIYSIEIFLDRWLLCIYHEKLVEIWDLDSVIDDPHKPILCTSQNIRGAGSFSSAITHLDEDSNLLTIAVSCHELCQVLQVQLRPSSVFFAIEESEDLADVQFTLIADIPIISPVLCLRAMDPSQALLLLSLPSSFHLLNWATGQRINVQMLAEEEEELWNGVVGATFLTSRHILVLKAHSIEICTLLDAPHSARSEASAEATTGSAPPSGSATHPLRFSETHMGAMVRSHHLTNTTFRGASFARPTVHFPSPHLPAGHPDSDTTKVSTSFLAFDVLRGLFHFSVEITLPLPPAAHDTAAPVDVHIQLLASHNMALPVFPHPQVGALSPRSGFSHGNRGFVSACALGPTGRRGVWVERRRGAVRRVVYGFDAAKPTPDDMIVDGYGDRDAQKLEDLTETADTDSADTHSERSASPGDHPIGTLVRNVLAGRGGAIDGREVYEVNSYDLRDDITHVAFSEATGLIALGTRKGEIRVLGGEGPD